jgi:hypothetical protein
MSAPYCGADCKSGSAQRDSATEESRFELAVAWTDSDAYPADGKQNTGERYSE